MKWLLAFFAAFAPGFSVASDSGAYRVGIDCVPCADTDGACVINTKVNLYASQTGYFEFEGCEGVLPTLHLTIGRTYIFDQSDVTNWYHLLGISYEHDGSMEPGFQPPGDNAGAADVPCGNTLKCPAPMYIQNGEYKGVYSNNDFVAPINRSDDFGLDAVEDLFKLPVGNWEDMGPFQVAFNFDDPYHQDIFYYCHMHDGMTGRIKLLDFDGNMLNPENTPAVPYEYHAMDEFDDLCGTFNISAWQLPNDQCPEAFVHGSGQSVFKDCVQAMDCHMMASMTTHVGEGGAKALFARQMIPHHENAVNMAKSLLKHSPELSWDCDRDERGKKPVGCYLLPILYDIINGQNRQIQRMQKYVLDQMEVEEFAECKVDFAPPAITDTTTTTATTKNADDRRRIQSTASRFESGIPCEPCLGTIGDCTIKVRVNLYASELGYFAFDGCDGVNPTLHLTQGRNYIFDQSDISNWYHLLGISYEHDGSMEPGFIPNGDGCADTQSCPAPMYFQQGEYKGVYSNNNNTAPVTTGEEDFGLDAVEDLFKYPIGNWEDLGPFKVELNYDVPYDQDIFYYCHMHDGMTGRIKLLDADGNMLNPEDTPLLPFAYDDVSSYDEICGTYGLFDFQLPNTRCPEMFVCGVESNLSPLTILADCIDSMDCAMFHGMTTGYGGQELTHGGTDDIALFIYQMIPHHQNAVNMAKSLLKSGETDCRPDVQERGRKSTECRLEPIVRSIINTQNRQIQRMRRVLRNIGATPTDVPDVGGINYVATADEIPMSSDVEEDIALSDVEEEILSSGSGDAVLQEDVVASSDAAAAEDEETSSGDRTPEESLGVKSGLAPLVAVATVGVAMLF